MPTCRHAITLTLLSPLMMPLCAASYATLMIHDTILRYSYIATLLLIIHMMPPHAYYAFAAHAAIIYYAFYFAPLFFAAERRCATAMLC